MPDESKPQFTPVGPGWSEWYSQFVSVYADDTPWDDPNLDLDEHRVGCRHLYLSRYTEEFEGKHITDAVEIDDYEIELNGGNPEAIANLIQAKIEVAMMSITDLKKRILAGEVI